MISKLTKEVKRYAKSLGAELIGVAPIERFTHGPKKTQPTYYMPNAKSVLVIGIRFPKAVGDVWGTYREEGKTIGPYLWFGYPELNWELSTIAARVSRHLESKGYKALPIPPTGFIYRYFPIADFSHRHAAVAAGLGETGLSGLFLSPQFGAYQRLVSIITNASLNPDPIYKGLKLCDPALCGYKCINECPVKALDGEKKVKYEIQDRTFEYAKFNPDRCKWAVYALHKGSGSRTHFKLPKNPTLDKLIKALPKRHPADAQMYLFTHTNFCGRCMHRCPAPILRKR